MKNAILVLIGASILLTWIFTAENRQPPEDPKIKWKRSSEATHSQNQEVKPEGIEIPVTDPNLSGCFSGTLKEGSLAGTQFGLEFSTPPETRASDRTRFIQLRGGFKKVREIARKSLTRLPPKSGCASGYQLPLSSSESLEIYFNSETKSWDCRLYLSSRPGNIEPTVVFTLQRTESCL